MPDQRVETDAEREVPPEDPATDAAGEAGEAGDRLVVVALYVFFIALLLLVGAMTLLPIVLR